jgi:hypothetical protein
MHESLTYELSPEGDEQLDAAVEHGAPILYMNRSGMLTMAKILKRIREGPYSEQFHIHLRKDFGDEGPEVLTIILYSGNGQPRQ